ncbi:MAG: hypothetical protein SGI90_13310, partial [Candidatus Eisenbacteria bacterium]|nr:hypothetical protein [Candidatus Eisenbacteria bacterium]
VMRAVARPCPGNLSGQFITPLAIGARAALLVGLTAHGDDPGVTNSVKPGAGTIGTNAKTMHEGPDRKRLNRP